VIDRPTQLASLQRHLVEICSTTHVNIMWPQCTFRKVGHKLCGVNRWVILGLKLLKLTHLILSGELKKLLSLCCVF
jgi:hypothetical protein